MKRLDRLLSTVNGNGKPVNPLEQLNRQLDLVRTRVISAATRHSNGLFLFGRAGVGKTFAVTEQLKKCKVDWVEAPTGLTAQGHARPAGRERGQVHPRR